MLGWSVDSLIQLLLDRVELGVRALLVAGWLGVLAFSGGGWWTGWLSMVQACLAAGAALAICGYIVGPWSSEPEASRLAVANQMVRTVLIGASPVVGLSLAVLWWLDVAAPTPFILAFFGPLGGTALLVLTVKLVLAVPRPGHPVPSSA